MARCCYNFSPSGLGILPGWNHSPAGPCPTSPTTTPPASEEPAPGSGTTDEVQPTPAGAARKQVTVNPTNLHGATAGIGSALTYANTRVYPQANVEIVKGKELTLDEPQSKAILGDDLILEEYSDPATPTTEERALLKENQSAGTVTVYFVKGL